MRKAKQFTMISSHLEQKPKFIRLAARVGRCMARGIVLGAWMHADAQGEQVDGGALLPGKEYQPGDLDLACGGPAEEHLEAVGWLEHREDGIFLPGFTCAEMRRAEWAARKAEYRKEKKAARSAPERDGPDLEPIPKKKTRAKPAKPLFNDDPGDFEAWWAAYPKREGKGHAAKAYAKAVGDGASPSELLGAAKRQAQAWQDEGVEYRYIKMPTTWLNARCWEDAGPPAGPVHDLTDAERDADPLGVPDPVKDAGWWRDADPSMSPEDAEKNAKADALRYAEELREYRIKQRRKSK